MNESRVYMPQVSRLLPQDAETEKALLGSLIISARLFPEVIEMGVTPSTFHIPANAGIYDAMLALYNANQPIDEIVLMSALKKDGRLEECGGPAYVSELRGLVPSSANALFYAEILLEKQKLRGLIVLCTEAASRAYDDQESVHGLITECASGLAELSAPSSRKRRTFKDAILEKLDRLENNEPDADVILTGIERLDFYSPMHLGDMPLICGERKAGKSIMSLNIARKVAEHSTVLYFSLEDMEAKAVDRIFSAHSEIPIIKESAKQFNPHELQKAITSANILSGYKMILRDDIFDLDKIVAVARQTKATSPDLALIVVDYAQLVRCVVKKNANREQEVATVSRTLRLLSMELRVALILLCQLNADGESRESRALEQDATACWKIQHTGKEPEAGRRIIAIPWQRNGDSGIGFPIVFRGHIAKIENAAREEHEKYEK